MERLRWGYRRPNALQITQQRHAREATPSGEKLPPMYWINSERLNQEVFSEVLNIVFQVFNKNPQDAVNVPTVEDVLRSFLPGGPKLFEWQGFGKSSLFFEAVSKTSEKGLFLRFKAYPVKGSQANADRPIKKREDFQNALDDYFKSENIAVETGNIV